jgi:2-octaprenylphenol hydroxylase
MQQDTHYDVIICGGGMVGLSLALALAPGALRIALLDQQPPQKTPQDLHATLTLPHFDARVSALTPASRTLLERLGVWQALAQLRLCAYTDMHVWDADGTGSIHFAAAEMHQPCLGYIVENGLVSAVLAEAAAASAPITLLQGASLDSFVPEITTAGRAISKLTLASGASLSCDLLIGADGGASRVRTLAGFTTREWDYGHQALVTTVRTERPHQYTAWQRFMSSGPLAFLPLELPGSTAQHYSSIVWSCVPELATELLALDDARFARRLEQAFESRLGRVEQVAARQVFPLWQKHASDYVQNGVALVGDAAHTIHPLAGQGVNLGLADVQSLSGVLLRAHARGENLASEQVLSRYQRERKAANLGMMLVMEGFKRAFGSEDLTLRWLRNAGLKAADKLGPFKREVMSRAMGLK